MFIYGNYYLYFFNYLLLKKYNFFNVTLIPLLNNIVIDIILIDIKNEKDLRVLKALDYLNELSNKNILAWVKSVSFKYKSSDRSLKFLVSIKIKNISKFIFLSFLFFNIIPNLNKKFYSYKFINLNNNVISFFIKDIENIDLNDNKFFSFNSNLLIKLYFNSSIWRNNNHKFSLKNYFFN